MRKNPLEPKLYSGSCNLRRSNMAHREVELGMKIFDKEVLLSTMMFVDTSIVNNNENYKSMYCDFNPENSNLEVDDDQDVKIWIPISSRI
jgi:hypothetical protein